MNREFLLKYNYNITVEEYNTLLNKQNDICAICKKPETILIKTTGKVKPLSVDHCHITGKVRGLLCDKCNTGLGRFNDNLNLLLNAAKYLKESIG